MQTRNQKPIFSLILLAFLFGWPIAAQSRPDCKADVKQYCQNTKPGNGRVMRCLQTHIDKLQPGCKSMVERWQAVKDACETDKKKFCESKSGAELQECIRQNRKNFSPACKSAVHAARSM